MDREKKRREGGRGRERVTQWRSERGAEEADRPGRQAKGQQKCG